MEHSDWGWNVRVKTYPDGKQQYFLSELPIKQTVHRKEAVRDGSKVELKEEENQSRAIQRIYDLARSTKWDWFINLTFSPEEVDRFDYDAVSKLMVLYTRSLRYYNCLYLVIPEQHKKGSWHFHGLVKGDFPKVKAVNPHTGKFILDNHGRQVYNITNFKVGFTQATQIGDSDRSVTYLTKYITKGKMMKIPKGRNRFWASRKLPEPEVETYLGSLEEAAMLLNCCRYKKEIQGKFSRFFVGEL